MSGKTARATVIADFLSTHSPGTADVLHVYTDGYVASVSCENSREFSIWDAIRSDFPNVEYSRASDGLTTAFVVMKDTTGIVTSNFPPLLKALTDGFLDHREDDNFHSIELM